MIENAARNDETLERMVFSERREEKLIAIKHSMTDDLCHR